jgi:hypothetical protein
MATTAVHAIIGRVDVRARTLRRAVSGALTLLAVGVLVLFVRVGFVQTIAPWAALPVTVVALALVTRPPLPRQLRTVGWTLVVATAATSILLVVALR